MDDYNPDQSPKERFLLNEQLVSSHKTMVDSYAFLAGTDMALLQMIEDESTQGSNHPELAAACHHRVAGAKAFLSILKTLAETHTPTKQSLKGQLDYRA